MGPATNRSARLAGALAIDHTCMNTSANGQTIRPDGGRWLA